MSDRSTTLAPAPAGSGPAPHPQSVAASRAASAGAASAAGRRPPRLSGWSTATSPGWYRLWAVITVAAIALFAVLAATSTILVRSSSQTIESNTAPSLIAIQDLFASVAEADASATAVFLSGTTGEEDRARRNLYLDALRRSAQQTEEVAGLVGNNETSHDALKTISVALTEYSGLIESSRQGNLLGEGNAEGQLRAALDLSQSDIAGAVATVTDRNEERLDTESNRGMLLAMAALAAGVVAVLLLLWLQYGMFKRSNRVLNPALVLATLLLVALIAVVSRGLVAKANALDNARSGGYDSIDATADVQASAFALQSDLSLRLLGSGGDDATELIANLDREVGTVALFADSTRERAVAAELEQRWVRYRDTATEIIALSDGGDDSQAVALFQGEGVSTFNGLNTSLESVLSDNRTQFADAVGGAARAVGRLPLYAVVLPVLAALAVVVGVQRRLGDYQ